jgi:hypothetical protein
MTLFLKKFSKSMEGFKESFRNTEKSGMDLKIRCSQRCDDRIICKGQT